MSGRLTVVGLGPAGPDLVTASTSAAIAASEHRYLRTVRHPSAEVMEGAESFDAVYDQSASLDEVYRTIVDRLVAASNEHDDVVYGVPGSPLVAEHSVELLRERATAGELTVDVLPALSFADLAWIRLGLDPIATGVRFVDGHRFAVEAAGDRGPLLVAQTDTTFVLSDVKLSVEEAPKAPVVLLHHLGLDDEVVVEVEWAELDRALEPDHLTCLFIPELAAPVAVEMQRLAGLVEVLRDECPWDREQTHDSLTKHLIEETYELVASIEQLDPETGSGYDDLEEELGDVLYQVFFHSLLASEEGQFSVAEVARGIHDKLYGRHPHVFGDFEADDADAVRRNWERIKKVEKGRGSILDGIPSGLPALLLALKVQKKARTLGMDFADVTQVFDKIGEELGEVRAEPNEDEIGDLLFAVTGASMHLSIDPEAALRRAAARFSARFRLVEDLASEWGVDLHEADEQQLDALWEAAKRALDQTPNQALKQKGPQQPE